MKIIYCILGTYNSGGMERVLANKANYLSGLGYDITIVTTDQKNRTPYFELDSKIKLIDLDINYTENSKSNLFSKIILYKEKQIKHRKELAIILNKLKADIVISMFDHDASFITKIKDGSKKVLEIHFSRYKRLQYGRKGLWKLVDNYRSKQDLNYVKKFEAFVVLTEEDKGYWGELKNIVVIPNMNSFVPKAQSELDTKRAIAVGRYDYQKNFEELIDAWTIIYEKHTDWRLDIFGNGPLKDRLQSKIDYVGLSDVIRLNSSVKDIETEYINSSMLAMTSRYEGLPMALLEAQSCGLPLVSYKCKCGPKDIIQDGVNGFLIESGDVQGLSSQLLVLIENPKLRNQMGDEGIKLAENFSEKIVMEKWLSLFKSLKK
ncbi:glycosyltransferase family 4 protein [Sphingobacterium hungaricum]